MKELTIEEKIKGYEYALDQVQNNKFSAVCPNLLEYIEDNFNISLVPTEEHNYFEEFIRYKPSDKVIGSYWFDSNETRITILKEIIAELKQQVK